LVPTQCVSEGGNLSYSSNEGRPFRAGVRTSWPSLAGELRDLTQSFIEFGR
jgi:hypothetical protein